jgi:alkanesulfonate monooxygenase SsuD/methylene tetrahydromethanopterin reductase-like flavin-dependent oxidoreductase (luciferase family)
VHIAASGPLTAALVGEVGDGLIGVSSDARSVDVFRGSRTGPDPRRCLGQLHVCLADTVAHAREQAFTWWPNGVVPSTLVGELSRPEHFEAVAAAVGRDGIGDVVVCAADAGPLVAAIDRFVGAGFDTVYLHQVGPDQQRLLDCIASDLLPHYGR